LLRVGGHGTRVADLATQSAWFRAIVVSLSRGYDSRNIPMNISRRRFLKRSVLAATLPFGSATSKASQTKLCEVAHGDRLVLWYEEPAREWVEALPIGNGRFGAMVFGGTASERLQLNEDTLYAGGPYDPNNREALATLPEARRLIFAGKYKEAHELIGAKMMATPIKQMPYEPIGDLRLDIPGHDTVSNYRRELDLDTAIVKVSYDVGGVHFTRELFASPVDHVIVVNITADRPGQISFAAGFATPQKAAIEAETNRNAGFPRSAAATL